MSVMDNPSVLKLTVVILVKHSFSNRNVYSSLLVLFAASTGMLVVVLRSPLLVVSRAHLRYAAVCLAVFVDDDVLLVSGPYHLLPLLLDCLHPHHLQC